MLAMINFLKLKKIKMAGHQKQFPKAVCSVLPHGAVVITYVAIYH